MKKFIAIALALLTVFSFSTAAFAEGNTTTLTTTVPDATYTLNIPADQEITFGKTVSNIGKVNVTNSSGFATGKNLKVTLTYDKFKSAEVSTTIPYYIEAYGGSYTSGQVVYDVTERKDSGSCLIFKGLTNNLCDEYFFMEDSYGLEDSKKTLRARINSTDWGKALGGEYTSTITFTAEVVSGS